MKKKICTKCKLKKLFSKFYKDKSKNDGYYYWCKRCWQDYCGVHKEQIKITHKKWREENKEKIKIHYKKCYKQNYGAYVINTIKRRFALEQRIPVWANLKIIKKFYTKAIQLTKKTGVQYDVDHIIPLQGKNVSGLHVQNNLRVIRHIINMKKHNTWIS